MTSHNRRPGWNDNSSKSLCDGDLSCHNRRPGWNDNSSSKYVMVPCLVITVDQDGMIIVVRLYVMVPCLLITVDQDGMIIE